MVAVDRNMWTHIVLNLLSNAVKFTASGTVTLTLRINKDRAELAVRDTGRGIAEKDIPAIFERFHQLGTDERRPRRGAGIWLSLVADLVHAHGGSVEVTSTPGQGSTFTVSLPQSPVIGSPRPLDPDAGTAETADTYLSETALSEAALSEAACPRRPCGHRSRPSSGASGSPPEIRTRMHADCCWSRTTPTWAGT